MHHTPARNRAKCLAIVEILSLSDSLVPVNTQDRPYPSEIIVLIQHTVTVHSSVTDIGCYFFNLFYMSMWYWVTVPTLEFDYLYTYILH